MTRENKELLLKDLSARLPYNTIVQIKNSGIWNLKGVEQDKIDEIGYKVIVWHGKNYPSSKTSFPISICKPYLFPLSSMNEEQREELKQRGWYFDCFEIYNVDNHGYREAISHEDCFDLIDWFNKNHFDYRGLIEKGLALDATNLNIY